MRCRWPAEDVGLRPLPYWYCGFESRRRHGSLSLLRVVCCLSGTGICNGPITRAEETYRVWCVWVWSRKPDKEETLAHYSRRVTKKIKGVMYGAYCIRLKLSDKTEATYEESTSVRLHSLKNKHQSTLQYSYSVRTSQKAHCVSIRKPIR